MNTLLQVKGKSIYWKFRILQNFHVGRFYIFRGCDIITIVHKVKKERERKIEHEIQRDLNERQVRYSNFQEVGS